VPDLVRSCAANVHWTLEDIDFVVAHQGSLAVIEALRSELEMDADRLPFWARHYGNTVSSSSAMALMNLIDEFKDPWNSQLKIILCGFGVGLSASAIALDCGSNT
jgi:3-oxoacyl-[acyl-carrier-protein] synthase III